MLIGSVSTGTVYLLFTFIHHKGRTKEKKHIKAHAEAHTQTQQY